MRPMREVGHPVEPPTKEEILHERLFALNNQAKTINSQKRYIRKELKKIGKGNK